MMFESTHRLVFEVAPYDKDPDGITNLYRVGTVHGQWFCSNYAYHILSFINSQPHNGHLEDVFEWFENSCKRDCLNLMIMDFFNERFYLHCIKKRGFMPVPNSYHLIKIFQ